MHICGHGLYGVCSYIAERTRVVCVERAQANTTLQTLNLWSNKVGNDGAKSLAEALKVSERAV